MTVPEESDGGRSSVAVENRGEGEAIDGFRTDNDVILHLIPETLNARASPSNRRHTRHRRRRVDRNRGATVTTTVRGIHNKATASFGGYFGLAVTDRVKAMKVRTQKRHDSVSQAKRVN